MRQLMKLLLFSLLVCSVSCGAIAQKSGRTTRTPSTPSIVCEIASVPKGMVVVGYKRNSACTGGTELLVKQPENGDIICAESPLPPEYSITTEAQGNLVGTCPKKAFLISRASSASHVDNKAIGRAFANGESYIQVEGEGTVVRVLPDDLDGSRHQRFIVQLESGQTLLFAHNIDVAPRIDELEEGDRIRFSGEYVWNAKGGVIHWTHHDPQGSHVSGWVIHNGKKYK
jgi:hypothetical protein